VNPRVGSAAKTRRSANSLDYGLHAVARAQLCEHVRHVRLDCAVAGDEAVGCRSNREHSNDPGRLHHPRFIPFRNSRRNALGAEARSLHGGRVCDIDFRVRARLWSLCGCHPVCHLAG
jgi:hypothetical protein